MMLDPIQYHSQGLSSRQPQKELPLNFRGWERKDPGNEVMIIGAYRKYQVKLYLCRAFGEVANHTSLWGAQANLKTINKGKNDNNNKKQTKKKANKQTEKVYHSPTDAAPQFL